MLALRLSSNVRFLVFRERESGAIVRMMRSQLPGRRGEPDAIVPGLDGEPIGRIHAASSRMMAIHIPKGWECYPSDHPELGRIMLRWNQLVRVGLAPEGGIPCSS